MDVNIGSKITTLPWRGRKRKASTIHVCVSILYHTSIEALYKSIHKSFCLFSREAWPLLFVAAAAAVIPRVSCPHITEIQTHILQSKNNNNKKKTQHRKCQIPGGLHFIYWPLPSSPKCSLPNASREQDNMFCTSDAFPCIVHFGWSAVKLLLQWINCK